MYSAFPDPHSAFSRVPRARCGDGKCKPNRKNGLRSSVAHVWHSFFAKPRDKRVKPLGNKRLQDGTEAGTPAGHGGTLSNKLQFVGPDAGYAQR